MLVTTIADHLVFAGKAVKKVLYIKRCTDSLTHSSYCIDDRHKPFILHDLEFLLNLQVHCKHSSVKLMILETS